MLLLKEMLTQPGFRQDNLDLLRVQMRNGVLRRNDSPETLTQREFRSLIFGNDTAYGWRQQLGTVDHITRTDVRNFYQRYYFPANVMIGIRGDFATTAMQASLTQLFADWTVAPNPAPEFPKVKNQPTPGVYLAEKKDATQTYFTIGHLGGQFSDKDYPALEVMVHVLGGSRGRLAERTRAKMGNPTDIRASWAAAPDHPDSSRSAETRAASPPTKPSRSYRKKLSGCVRRRSAKRN